MKAMMAHNSGWFGFITGGIAGVTKFMLDVHADELQRFLGGAFAAVLFGFLGKLGADLYLVIKRKFKK